MPGAAILGTALTTHAVHGFGLFVEGEDIIAPVNGANKGVPLDSIEIEETGTNAAGRMTFRFEDPAKAYSLPEAGRILYWDFINDLPIFGGFITARDIEPDFGQQGRAVVITCTDLSPLLDQRYVIAAS